MITAVGLVAALIATRLLALLLREGDDRIEAALAQALNEDSAEPISHLRVVSGPRRTTSLAIVHRHGDAA